MSQKKKKHTKTSQEYEEELEFRETTPFWDILDIDRKPVENTIRLFLFRLAMQMVQVHFMYHPDENWQSLEVAYDLVYGKRSGSENPVDILLSWEWFSFYALRNHLYPFWLSLPAQVMKFVGLDTNFLVVNSMYFMHCVVWSFGDYFYFYLVKTLAGRRCAILTTMLSLSSQTVNRYVSRTSMNGVEGNLAIAGLYYFLHLKPKIFDPNLSKMTLLITISFLARSSSLAAWIPLAIFKIIEDTRFFVPIVVAGLTVTLPAVVASIGLDSLYYETWTVPQINFVHVNVIENVSQYFGVDPGYFYLVGLQEDFCTVYILGIFGLSLFTVRQLFGSLAHYNEAMSVAGLKVSRIPCIFIFVATYLFVLGKVDHKERRFYTPVAQLGCFAQAFGSVQFYQIAPLRSKWKLLLILLMAHDGIKMILCVLHYAGVYYSMLEPYDIFNGRSPHLYTGPINDQTGKSSFVPAESVYYFDQFELPPHLLAHSQLEHQTTVMYQQFRQPIFVNKRIPDLPKMTHPANENLTFPVINSPWVNNDSGLYAYIHLYHMSEYEGVYPEYLWGHYGENLVPQPQLKDHLWLKVVETFKKWYDIVDEFHGVNAIRHEDRAFRNPTRVLMRLKPQFDEKKVQRGYWANKANRKSMGMLIDLQRAFVRYESPLAEQWEHHDPVQAL